MDPVTLAVLDNRLRAIVEEMGEAMLRTSYSQILNSSRDFSVALCGADGGLVAQADRGSFHLADIVCKCVGFEVNEGNERLFGRAWMGADGMVGRGTWVLVEPYLDARASGLPLIGHVNGVNWAAKMITRFWRQGGVPVASVMTPGTTLQRVRINHVSASDATDALLQAAASDPEIRAELRSHVQSVTEACHAGWRAEEYLECNRRQWFELQRQLLSSRACHSAPGAVPSIPYPFEDALRVLDRDVAHMMQPAVREYYHLEEIWGGKPVRVKLGAPGGVGRAAA
jgi:hypothetical protein